MLEALLLTAVATGDFAPLADGSRAPSKPSLELLEFLGEFGDDEDGLFDEEGSGGVDRKPAKDARVAPAPPVKPAAPATPPAARPKEST